MFKTLSKFNISFPPMLDYFSFCPISIKFDMKVHLVGLYAENDFFF